MSALCHAGLVRLAFRRAAPLAFLVAYALLLALATRAWTPPVPLESGEDSLVRGLARSGAWSLFGVLALPFVTLAAARAGARWSRGDAEWLAPTPARRSAFVLSAFLGTWAAALALALLTALAGEVAARAPHESSAGTSGAWRWRAALENPGLMLPDGAAPARWPASAHWLGRSPRAARVLLRPTVAPGSGPAVTAAFSLVSEGATLVRVERRIHGKSTLALDVPAGAPAGLEFEFARVGEGAVLVLPASSLALLVPAASERLAGLELLVRTAACCVALLALAQGLGSWMRPALAAGSVLALALLPEVAGKSGWLLGELFRAWSLAGEGLVPAPLAPALWLQAALALAVGLALHWIALGTALARGGRVA